MMHSSAYCNRLARIPNLNVPAGRYSNEQSIFSHRTKVTRDGSQVLAISVLRVSAPPQKQAHLQGRPYAWGGYGPNLAKRFRPLKRVFLCSRTLLYLMRS